MQTLPHFDLVEQLLAAAHYAKHGWKTVDQDIRTFRITIEKTAKEKVDETYRMIEGQVTANEVAVLMKVSESCARRRLNALVGRGLLHKTKRQVEGKSRSAKEFVFFKK